MTLDLSKPLATSTGSGSAPASTQTVASSDNHHQRMMIVSHAIVCVVGFALLLPSGVLLARYLRTFTPTWYTGHWIAQFGIAGPVIIAGFVLGFKASGKEEATQWDTHKKTGVVLFALYLFQCSLGAFIHYVKPKNFVTIVGRQPQNYFHAVFGLAIIALAMYQIRTGYRDEWPQYAQSGDVPKGVNVLWIVWCIVLPILYAAGLSLLPKQYRQEDAQRKGLGMSDSSIDMRQQDGGMHRHE